MPLLLLHSTLLPGLALSGSCYLTSFISHRPTPSPLSPFISWPHQSTCFLLNVAYGLYSWVSTMLFFFLARFPFSLQHVLSNLNISFKRAVILDCLSLQNRRRFIVSGEFLKTRPKIGTHQFLSYSFV